MAKLILKKKAQVITEYDLDELTEIITVGSEFGNTIVIDDRKISITHLRIEREHDQFFVTDLRSAFGTKVNGQDVTTRVQIKKGDEIQLGEHVLILTGYKASVNNIVQKIDMDSQPGRDWFAKLDQVDDKKKTEQDAGLIAENNVEDSSATIFRNDETIAPPFRPRVDAADHDIEPPSYDLLTIYGPYRGKRYRLKTGTTKIGRDQTLNDIIINTTKDGKRDKSISRRHVTITTERGKYFISDKRSKFGTYLNQYKLEEDDSKELKDGDEIEVVSNYKSTIFRFVPSDNMDFSYPHVAGEWWIRYRKKIELLLFGLFTIVGIIMFFIAMHQRSVILRKPDELRFIHEILKCEQLFSDARVERSQFATSNNMPSPALADINNDGANDLILITPEGMLFGFDLQERKKIWQSSGTAQSGTDYSVVIDDLNGDNLSEILVSGRDSRVYVYDGKYGRLLWRSDFLGGTLSSQPSVGDLNNDGNKDIVVCSQEGVIHIGISHAQDYEWIRRNFKHMTRGVPCIADLDDDQANEIIIGTENGKLMMFNVHDWEIEAREFDINKALKEALGVYSEDNSINNAIALGHIRTDDETEVPLVITTRQYRVIALNPLNLRRLWFDKLPDPLRPKPRYHSSPLLCDLNADGCQEAIITYYNGDIPIKVYTAKGKPDGTHKKLWQFDRGIGKGIVATPALADMNKDKIIDIIATDAAGIIYILNGSNGKKLYESEKSAASFTASPVIGDGDGDGYIDVIVMDNSYNIHFLHSNARVFSNSIAWSQYGGNGAHDCHLEYPYINTSKYSIRMIIGVLLVLSVVIFGLVSYYNLRNLLWDHVKNIDQAKRTAIIWRALCG